MMGHDHEHGDSEGRRSSTHHLAKSAKTFFDHGKAHAKEYTGFSITDGSRVHCGDSFNSGENFVYNAAPEPKLGSSSLCWNESWMIFCSVIHMRCC